MVRRVAVAGATRALRCRIWYEVVAGPILIPPILLASKHGLGCAVQIGLRLDCVQITFGFCLGSSKLGCHQVSRTCAEAVVFHSQVTTGRTVQSSMAMNPWLDHDMLAALQTPKM
eukprot:374353-Prymnesium_polylepis.1